MIADYFFDDITIDGLFLDGDFVDALLVTATFEGSCEELVHNLASHVVVDETTGHDEHIGIVMLTDEVGNLRNPAQSGTHLLVLVQRHADTLARAADGNARIDLAALDALG